MKYAIVTGDSRGLGEAIAGQFLEKGIHVIGISRTYNEDLKDQADGKDVTYSHISCDLSDADDLTQGIDKVMYLAFQNDVDMVYLVNNAGVIDPIETVGNLETGLVNKHLQINLSTPILFINRLLKEANEQGVKAGIVNITSGAAEKTVHGWSVYSSGKAAINQFTATTAMEQEKAGKDHTIIAYSPGVVDTEMQGEIRAAAESAFADVDKFKKLKEEGQLRPPQEVARVLMDVLFNNESIENGKVYKLYDLINK
ncbi:short-chain dehydrogenase [Halobacillus andaensis]|uniref:Short-chain dehydrogenase n=1 Tax=Halobacillus andaensis TaxID=1176239 RepID=A0A917EU51_HALAA|nr:(S)-benzoin forming benzil reductase [Halobacillus andaensis]MBP2004183.1 benzil reductase ((S)-benzoin forming) [Halobacillus andaensis]GGF16427.1 short-chain dehydrogenase [Halobacillus andaensis]